MMTSNKRWQHGFKTEEQNRRGWQLKQNKMDRSNNREESCRRFKENMIDEALLALVSEMFWGMTKHSAIIHWLSHCGRISRMRCY